ncbi:methyltransferase type 11 [Mesorhizobium sp. RMAD-H1]|uniref:methyltransferase type 11 n=1 Tax=Mesorhizobium sp. RMAD-H1 TaxID=2587065 RepID=UPI0016186DDD|nr:methyltransferase type 11 [Mesorhizobium sp. RMAD-H1]MBB2970081.1 hypothetical protein [Mesorhizobium sp. RMAD-H1]
MPRLNNHFRQLTNALRYLARGDLPGLVNRLKWYGREYSNAKVRKRLISGSGAVWGILCTPHTLFVAQAISARLASHGIGSEIITGQLKRFDHDFYIVLCAQMFKQLPPGNRRVIFQLEQSVSSRWFTDKYIRDLEESFAVLEYSLTNIEFLAKKGVRYPHVHYLPIGAYVDEGAPGIQAEKKYDFVFYGDSLSSERRRSFLQELQSRYTVRICKDVFGEEMHGIIREAKAVINIHYYEGALLETPRLCECISLGVPVLSEGTADQGEYPELDGAVKFFEQGSIEAMMSAADEMMRNIRSFDSTLPAAAATSADRFAFMFDRFLVALGVLPANAILEKPIYVAEGSSFFALSLPETIDRRRAITRIRPDGCVIFDGIRNTRGWVGCASSFNALSRYALDKHLDKLTVIEDDVILPPDFDKVFEEVIDYLDNRESRWDIFSGLMADIHPSARVLSVEDVAGRTYVTMDKMTSTVFNIYGKRALELLSIWNPLDTDAVTNTIDRYLERQKDLRIVVTLPFIAGHKEEMTSTLWGFENGRYTPMIAEAERKIEALVQEWRRKKR